MTDAKVRRPDGLLAGGRQMWDDIMAAYELRFDERRILEDACHEVDLIDRLERALRKAPLQVDGSMGQPVSNPLIQEIRQHRNTLAGLLAKLKLADTGAGEDEAPQAGDVVSATRSTAARAAANARWGRRGA